MKYLKFLFPVKRYVIDKCWFDLIQTHLLFWGSQNVKSEFLVFWILVVEFEQLVQIQKVKQFWIWISSLDIWNQHFFERLEILIVE